MVQHTIKTIYPKYYPAEVVDFFCEHHSIDAIAKDIEKEHALSRAKNMSYGTVFIGGNPNHYTRFGFEPSGRYGICHKDRENG